jgi:AraC family carnitine catabolism transcriptional activator
MAPAARTIMISLLLAPRFPLLSLAICTESLRVANRELGTQRFSRQILTLDGAPVLSSSGIELSADAAFADVTFAPVVLLLSSYQPEEAARPDLLAWLRGQDRRGAMLGCIDTGAYLLAKAGLLGGRHVVAHYEALPAYEELFGDALRLDRLFALEGRIASSAGGMATMDMMLKVIAHFAGEGLSDRVAHVLTYRTLDQAGAIGTAPGDAAVERVDRRLGRLVELMQANLEAPLALSKICEIARVESSTARRLFLRHLKDTPGHYYLGLRLDRARSLLTNSALPVGQISAMVGFPDPSAFSRAYHRHYGLPPSMARRADSGATMNL